VVAGVVAHVAIARRHGATALRAAMVRTRWPVQSIRNVTAMAVVFAALIAYTVWREGADLAAPADPASTYDARPLWYFRWLFELRELAGPYERVAALIAPAVVAGFLLVLPFADRHPRPVRARKLWIGAVVGLFALIGGLTVASFASDLDKPELAKRQDAADKLALHARSLAVKYGVPVTGALDVYASPPMFRARTLFAARCKGCHDADSKDRKGPIIGAGHGNREWLHDFLKQPSGDAYWGHTKLAKTDDAMKPAELSASELDDLVETIYAQSGAADADTAKRDRGKAIFDKTCTDCHSMDEGTAGASAPGLAGLGTRDYYTSFIGNPKSAVHMSTKSEMPAFDRELSIVDRDAIAGYLVWLRTAAASDLAGLDPL
jgi:ubiquinol-cytochrome c reductase cytochrome b subunit